MYCSPHFIIVMTLDQTDVVCDSVCVTQLYESMIQRVCVTQLNVFQCMIASPANFFCIMPHLPSVPREKVAVNVNF